MLYRDKADWIPKFTKGKKVLDLGCVRHNLEETEKSGWLHGLIQENAKSVLGVDYLEKEVSALRERGYNIICANVEEMELKDKFEVIVAGDIIEHLSNPGRFLEKVGEHLAGGGVFVVTTPNPIHFLRFIRVLFTGRADPNPEHAVFFTDKLLGQLAERYGLQVVEVAYIDDVYQYYKKKKWWPFLALNYLLCRIRPQLSETIGVVLRRDGG